MSLTSSLTNALSGLNVSGQRASVISNNIANAQTEGYGRRELATSSAWGGVRGDGIIRTIDRGLLADRRLAESKLGADQRSADMLGKIESIIGIPGDADSLAARLSQLESAMVSAANDPASDLRLKTLGSAMTSVLDRLHSASDDIQILRQDADKTIARDVEALNANLTRVEQLNSDITRLSASGQDPSSLMDARQQIIDDIGASVPIRLLERANDQVAIMTTSGLVLLDGKAAQFEFEGTPTIIADMTLSSGGLSGITMNGQPLDVDNGFGRLSGGALSASFSLRDDTLVAAQEGMDEIAFDLANRFSNTTTDPTIGATGMLTDNGNPIDALNMTGMSARLALNSAADPSVGGDATRWRDGIGGLGDGSVGDSSQLNRWHSALTNLTGESVRDNIASISANFSVARLGAETELSFSAARWDSLHAAELAGGVDSDVELQSLLQVEQAYAANARVIQTINAMMQQLMEI